MSVGEAVLVGWQEQLDALIAQAAPLVRRQEARARLGRVLRGLLGHATRKNGWQLAEAVGEREPHGVQRLLSEAVWDADGVRDLLRQYVTAQLGGPDGVLICDETGFLKKGTHSVGVARQYSGTAGKIENCQVGVFLAYASPRGHAFLDRALYLPRSWTDDPARLRTAGVPESVRFATKPELVRQMLERVVVAGVPHQWISGDSVYGDATDLRQWLESRHEPYALGVSSTHHIWHGGSAQEARTLVAALPATAWVQLSAGPGSQGERRYDWCWVRLADADTAGMASWLVARRTLAPTPEMAYFRVYGPDGTTLAVLALVIGRRWAIEQCIEEAKGEVGLDQYEVRGWVPWHRFITLALLAHAFLAVTRAAAPASIAEKGGPPSHGSR